MFAFGSIVLARFPFTDLSGDKRRPALVVSRDNRRRTDLVVCFITSVPRAGPDMAPIAPTSGTGLKVPSVVHFDKLATLDPAVITGKLGDAPASSRLAPYHFFRGVRLQATVADLLSLLGLLVAWALGRLERALLG